MHGGLPLAPIHPGGAIRPGSLRFHDVKLREVDASSAGSEPGLPACLLQVAVKRLEHGSLRMIPKRTVERQGEPDRTAGAEGLAMLRVYGRRLREAAPVRLAIAGVGAVGRVIGKAPRM